MTLHQSAIWRALSQRTRSADLPKGLDALWDSGAGLAGRLVPRRRRFLRLAQQVLGLERQYINLGSAKLREVCSLLRERFRRGRQTPDEMLHAFAVVREVAAREIGERPYLVQVAGAIAIEAGCIVEMATGEGKTLTATMPATLAGWKGRGCHVITANDYLAARDAEWMNNIYSFCGLRADYLVGDMPPPRRLRSYQADITYCTNKEVAADFLRDRLALGRMRGLPAALLSKISEGSGRGADRLVQRGLPVAIIDEADSLLIDEAVTPLIISGDAPNAEQVEAFGQAAALIGDLRDGEHYTVDRRYREVRLTAQGKRALSERASELGGFWTGARRREELAMQALTAHHFFQRDQQYVIIDGKVVIVDEFTGRLMPDRTWRDGLHQAIEAKEGLEVQPPKDTFARISFQRFFRLYSRLSGMTGTAREAIGEFWQIYRCPVVAIPTCRPCIRQMRPDRVFATETAKWHAIVQDTAREHKKGRPVLIGTRSVGVSDMLSRMLSEQGLDHQVLNAVRHKEEAQVVAGAGRAGCITVATNMAGRGTDIKLGRGVKEAGGLHVIATERHESERIDRQLYGRSARQGDPGSAQAIVSLEDELVCRYAPRSAALLKRLYGIATKEISSTAARKLFGMAQRRAARMALRQRKGVLCADDWLDESLGFAGSES